MAGNLRRFKPVLQLVRFCLSVRHLGWFSNFELSLLSHKSKSVPVKRGLMMLHIPDCLYDAPNRFLHSEEGVGMKWSVGAIDILQSTSLLG